MFDIKKVWKFAAKNKDEDANTFRWKNLNLLEESINNCWEKVVCDIISQHTGKNVYEIFPVDFLEIIKNSNKKEIHKLVCYRS
jgi:hypothetical protein